ncbi:hypothetical protein BWI93_17030 [Siphonobacter sp. BAB-5385]|uniref:hypothetical protein n=1 Tax=Siphonobacter sp. BAB-5385 TaxID=1864822 RepID=UPI000B9E5F7B|nr:hypothetical protein [Siphonobacter sp. BAB-5385]OZI07009.1 hypothetical protein BWI93_17030 [Siphonobacter sp. BAB-5385]
MQSYIVPVYIQTNTLSLERITIGLLGLSEQVLFQVSATKISVASKLSKTSVKSFIQETLDLLKQTVDEQNTMSAQTYAFPKKELFQKEYLNYLKQYSHGLLQFGEAMPVAMALTEQSFAPLYEAFVGEAYSVSKPAPKKNLRTKVKEILSIPALEEKADIEYKVEPSKLEGILKEVTVSLLTKNGTFQAIQAVDFSTSDETINKNLNEFQVFASSLTKLSQKKFNKPGEYKVVAEVPEINTPQYELYQEVKAIKKDVFEIVSPAELPQITQYILSHSYSKASDYL